MASAATLQIILQARDNATSNLQGVGSALGQLGNLGKVALGGVAALGAGLTALIGTSTMAAASVSEARVVLDLLGERAGWTAEQVQRNVDAMMDLGIRSDVATSLLQQFARYQLEAADATDIARVAQDAAVLSQQDSSDALDQIMHGILTQNSLVLRNAGLNIMAGAAMDEYAASLGKTAAELTETERIQAMMNAVMEEGERIAGAYTTAMDEPGKALRSLRRHFFEARVEIGNAFLPAFGNVIEAVTQGITSFRGLLEEGEAVNRIFEALGQIAETVTMGLIEFAGEGDGLVGVLESVADATEAAADWIDRMIGPIMEATGKVLAWINENVALIDVLIALGVAMMVAVAIILGPVLLAIGKIILVFVAVTAAVAAVRSAWDSNFLGIRTITEAVMGFISLYVTNVMNSIEFVVTTVLGAIQNFWQAHGATIMAIAETVWKGIQAIIEVVTDTIRGIIEAFALAAEGDWRGFGEKLRETWDNLWESMQAILLAATVILLNVIANLIQDIIAWFQNTNWGEVGKAIIRGIANGVTDAASLIKDAVINAARAAWEGAKGFLGIRSPSKLFAEMGQDVMQGLIEGISTEEAEAIATVEKVVSNVVSAFKGLIELAEALEGLTGPVSIGATAWASFMESLEMIMFDMSEMASTFEEEFFAHTQGFADTVGKATGVLAKAVEGLKALASYAEDGRVVTGKRLGLSLRMFLNDLEMVMRDMSELASTFKAEFFEHTQSFADTVGKVTGVLAKAVEGLTALAGYTRVGQATVRGYIMPALHDFINDLAIVMVKMSELAADFDAEFFEHTQGFADTVGKVTGVLAKAVEGLQSLAEYTRVGQATVHGYIMPALHDFVNDLGIVMVKMSELAVGFEAEFFEHTQAFSDTVGKVTSVLGKAVEGLKAVAGYIGEGAETTADNLGPSLDAFAADLQVVMVKMSAIAAGFEEEFFEHTQAFAKTVGAVTGILAKAVEGLKALAGYYEKGAEAAQDIVPSIAAFEHDLKLVLAMMGRIISNVTPEMMEDAEDVLNHLEHVFKTLELAIKTLLGIREYEGFGATVGRFLFDELADLWTLMKGPLALVANKLLEQSTIIAAIILEAAYQIEVAVKAWKVAMAEADSIGFGSDDTGLPGTRPPKDGGDYHFEIPVILDGREIGRASAKFTADELRLQGAF